jgi:hypothetical protein
MAEQALWVYRGHDCQPARHVPEQQLLQELTDLAGMRLHSGA